MGCQDVHLLAMATAQLPLGGTAWPTEPHKHTNSKLQVASEGLQAASIAAAQGMGLHKNCR
jgi:hypothetical protein